MLALFIDGSIFKHSEVGQNEFDQTFSTSIYIEAESAPSSSSFL
jgi:hypothetical protein